MSGGAGNDTYLFNRDSDADFITDIDATTGNSDTFKYSEDVSSSQLWFSRSGKDLEVSIIGTNTKQRVFGWYMDEGHQIEVFKAGDGKTLTSANVEKLVQAMAAFSPPPLGQTILDIKQELALSPVLAANWK